MTTVLIIGATGQVGRVVVEEALAREATVRAQTRSASRARRRLPRGAEVVEASPSDVDALCPVLTGADAVVLTHGTDSDGRGGATFYDVVRAVIDALDALGQPTTHVSLMTTMNASHSATVTGYEFVEWKRRAERLLRASGLSYTIVRPGWFDYQGSGDRRIDLRQGDLVTGQPGVDRHHIAQVLLEGALNPSGSRRTVEVFSASGSPVTDFEALLAATRADEPGSLDGVLDTNNVALTEEPARVQEDVARVAGR
ncbi:NAD-dependent epimerase/dehydratase family protein [Actinomyces sp. 2119]|uniref:NAD(P)H-binding protein n=1 Tax=Actinomyces sp. 2119 TaxID=2321393 RepID=UPI000E6C41FF|nr:NAD(P)H-binding protein [Actinomyces sp. 2119]RJF43234.1 NAD-dependent epimerase/dehydratase family protein [Actinomyces sp. 2119]